MLINCSDSDSLNYLAPPPHIKQLFSTGQLLSIKLNFQEVLNTAGWCQKDQEGGRQTSTTAN